MAEDLFIVGVGGHARVAHDAAIALGWRVRAWVDPRPTTDAVHDAPRVGVPILPGIASIPAGAAIFVAIGGGRHRQESAAEAARIVPGSRWPALIHPTARCEETAVVEAGVLVAIGAIVTADAHLGWGAIVNSGAIVEHECQVGRFAHVGPGAVLTGRVRVGEGAFIGAGARVIPHVTIGADAIVGAGAVVIRDVPAGATVVGVPSRRLGGS